MSTGSHLVLTPLSERCMVGLLGALNNHCGALLVGRSGVGKSATLRHLSAMTGPLISLDSETAYLDE